MADEQITNAELARRMAEMRIDIHDDLADIKTRLDQRVSREVYDAQRAALEHRVAALETRARFWIGTIIVPIAVVVIQWLLAFKGVKP